MAPASRTTGVASPGASCEEITRSAQTGSLGAAAHLGHRHLDGLTPPKPGRLRDALLVLAAKTWRHPDSGLDVHFGVSTLERWYCAARRCDDPLVALRDRLRGDAGRFPSMSEQAVAALTAQYRAHSGWTAQLHLDNLRVTLQAARLPVASYATVRRFLLGQGMHRKARPK